MRTLISWFADNHVAANLLMLFIVIAGAMTGLSMKIEVFPESSLDRIAVTVTYPGASPSEVEEGVIRPIEEKVAGLAGIKRMDSIAREGFGSVILEVMKGWNLETLLDEVKAEVDRLTTLPEEAEKPIIRELTQRTQVISMVVYGDAPESSLKHLARKLKDDITDLPGITLAELAGVRDDEIHIEISEETLRRYRLTLGQVAEAVRRASLDLPAGSIKTKNREILIRTKGRRYDAQDYRDVAVFSRPDGSKVTLGQIAGLKEGFEDVDIFARFQGKPAAMIRIYRVADQNALKVADTVKRYVESARDSLPEGLAIDFFNDTSKLLKSRISLLLKNMAIGLILVIILLSIFLDLKLAFWVTLGIPVSFLAGIWILPKFDVSINMVSLFAFIAVLGIVVDDAIVIGENIYRKQEEGYGPLKSAVDGALEVGGPVIFGVLTTVAAFWPLLQGSGMLGKVMWAMPIVVITVLLGSLLESLLILPAHLERSRRRAAARSRGQANRKRISRLLNRFVNGPYKNAVAFCVRWRYATLALGIAVLCLTLGLWGGGWVKFTLFPKVDGDVIICSVTMPAGTPVGRTVDIVNRLEQSAKQAFREKDTQRPPGSPPLLQHSVAVVGLHTGGHGPQAGSPEIGSHLAQVFVQILEGEKRAVSTSELTKLWRRKTGPIPDAESITFESSHFNAGKPVEVHLSHDDNGLLLAAADDLKEALKESRGIFDISDSFHPGKQEMQMNLKSSARSLGLTLDDLALQVRHAFYGAEALRLQRNREEVKVLVRYPDLERDSLGHVEEMRIRTPDGFQVPFSQVAEVNISEGFASIQRAQRMRVIKVTADADESVTNANEVRKDIENRILPRLTTRYPGLKYTMEGEGKEQKESLADVFRGFAIALFAIYALLAVPFRSFSQPFVVMAAIPFGIVGAVAGHLMMGFNLSLVSLFGMVGLAGVVVNDSLVLIHAANQLREKGAGPYEAIVNAGVLRFRAIILTSLTTFAGLTPMIMERSFQAKFLIPMAVSLGFGVLFSTIVTLFLIPCGYMIQDDIHGILRGRDA